MTGEEELHTIREQLTYMRRIMREAPDDRHIGRHFVRRLPMSSFSFTPEGWQKFNAPIWELWGDYLALLDQAIIDLHAYREYTRKLNVADLLAASKEESEK